MTLEEMKLNTEHAKHFCVARLLHIGTIGEPHTHLKLNTEHAKHFCVASLLHIGTIGEPHTSQSLEIDSKH